jgi:hypothetical protein
MNDGKDFTPYRKKQQLIEPVPAFPFYFFNLTEEDSTATPPDVLPESCQCSDLAEKKSLLRRLSELDDQPAR